MPTDSSDVMMHDYRHIIEMWPSLWSCSVESTKEYWEEFIDNSLKEKDEEEMKVKLDATACAPTRAYATDAGLDLRSPIDCVIMAHSSKTIDTGVHVQLPRASCGLLVSKSGLNVNHDITSTGLIDESYTGSIRVKLYNHGIEDYHIHRGDKISQLVIIPVITPGRTQLVEEFEDTERGDKGFGSSGR